jgi:hypothetical protein
VWTKIEVPDDAHSMCAFSFDYARIDRVDPNFPRPKLLRQHAGHRVDRTFRGGVTTQLGGLKSVTTEPILMTLPPASPVERGREGATIDAVLSPSHANRR